MTLIVYLYLSLIAWIGIFALHRFSLVVRYYAHKKEQPSPRAILRELPRITIQLPVFNEPDMAESLLKAVFNISYPADLLDVQILDDSTDETTQIISSLLAQNTWEASHIRRDSRKGFKAGALAEGLKMTDASLIVVFDADFIPGKDFLHEVVNYFSDPEVDMVQVRWGHLNRNSSFLTRAQALLLDGHFIVESTARNRSGCFFNFNGTAGIWRKTAIEKAGGWQADTLTEDLDLSYRAQLAGSKFVYLVDHVVPAELPESIAAFKSQQHRWTKGTAQVLTKLTGKLLTSDQPLKVKFEGMSHLASGICYPAVILIGLLIWPILETSSYWGLNGWQNTSSYSWASWLIDRFVAPAGLISFVFFYFITAVESKRVTSRKIPLEIFNSLITAIGLSLSNSLAFFEGILLKGGEFCRTPKGLSAGPTAWRSWFMVIEGLLATYFGLASLRLIYLEYYLTSMFLGIFFLSYLYVFSLSLNSRRESVVRSDLSNHVGNEVFEAKKRRKAA